MTILNSTNARTYIAYVNVMAALALLLLGTALPSGAQVPESFRNGGKLDVVLQEKDQKYEALIQPLLPAPRDGQTPSWVCKYQVSPGVHLAREGEDANGALSFGINAPQLRIIADNFPQNASIVFECKDRKSNPQTTTINLKSPKAHVPGQNVVILGQSSPVQINLTPDGSRYAASLNFMVLQSVGDTALFNCTYTTSSEWQLSQDGKDAAGYLAKLVPPAKIGFITAPTIDKSHSVRIDLTCSDGAGQPLASPPIMLAYPAQLHEKPIKPNSDNLDAVPGWVWLLLLALALVGTTSGLLYRSLRKLKGHQNARIVLEGRSSERSAVFDLVPNTSKDLVLRIPRGFEALDPPPNNYVSVHACDLEGAGNQSDEWPQNEISGELESQRHDDTNTEPGRRQRNNTRVETVEQQQSRRAYKLKLSREAKGSGAELLSFNAKAKGDYSLLTFPVVVRWNISTARQPVRSGEKEAPETDNQRTVVVGQPSRTTANVKADIVNLGNQIAERDLTTGQQLQRLTEAIEAIKDSNTSSEFTESVGRMKKEILESLYSEVNRATGDSLGEVRDSIKTQIREGFTDQLLALTELVNSLREQAQKSEPTNGSGEGLAHLALKRFVSEHATSAQVEKTMSQILASPAPSNDGLALASLARNLRDLATAVEETEKRFANAKGNAAKLAAEIRLRLLRMEWLALKYEDFRRNNSLPASFELNTANGGLEELSGKLAKAIEGSLQYWQSPKEYLEAGLDRLISRDLPELIKMCDSAGPGLFDDAVRKLLEVAHLEDISPRSGARYDPAGHLVTDYETGNRDTVIRVTTRGFRYKNQVLSKPTVIVGK